MGDVNLGYVLIEAQNQVYAYQNERIDRHSDNIDRYTEQMGKVVEMIELVNNKRAATGNKDQVVAFETEAERSLIEQIRLFAPNAIEQFKFRWEGKEPVDLLVENLNFEFKRISGLINPETQRMTECFDNRKSMTNSFKDLMDRWLRATDEYARRSRPN